MASKKWNWEYGWGLPSAVRMRRFAKAMGIEQGTPIFLRGQEVESVPGYVEGAEDVRDAVFHKIVRDEDGKGFIEYTRESDPSGEVFTEPRTFSFYGIRGFASMKRRVPLGDSFPPPARSED